MIGISAVTSDKLLIEFYRKISLNRTVHTAFSFLLLLMKTLEHWELNFVILFFVLSFLTYKEKSIALFRIADAEENLGESEVREAHLAKSLYFIQIGDKVE